MTIILLAIFSVSGVISCADVELPLAERSVGVGEVHLEIEEDNSDSCQFDSHCYISLDFVANNIDSIRSYLKGHKNKSIAIRAPPIFL